PDLLPARGAARPDARGADRQSPGARHGACPRLPGRRRAVGVAPALDRSAELRWFFPGRPPGPVVAWFEVNAEAPQTRVDVYLVLPGTDALGVKIRGSTTNLELKLRPRPAET